MSFIVEVSNPRLANDTAYERWELWNEEWLASRLESELGWNTAACEESAAEIAAGRYLEEVDSETGRTVTAWRRMAERVC